MELGLEAGLYHAMGHTKMTYGALSTAKAFVALFTVLIIYLPTILPIYFLLEVDIGIMNVEITAVRISCRTSGAA